MLVTKTKSKIRNAGQGEFVYLVPELCRATGLTDNMRENFHLMRALATHTRVSPESRIEKLIRFNDRLRQEARVTDELKDWNMRLERNLLEVPARILPPETLTLLIIIRFHVTEEIGREICTKHVYITLSV